MDMKQCMEVTKKYYSKWLGEDEILLGDSKGIEYLYSAERNRAQYGYSAAYDLYLFWQKERMVISYGEKAEEWIGRWKDEIRNGMSAAEVKQVLERISGQRAGHGVKYVLTARPSVSDAGARVLAGADYEEYQDFWRRCHPGSGDTSWLKDYFDEMAGEHMCIGVSVEDRLVSCTDAPGMPYMEKEVQEIGINTVAEYRGKGYASAACTKCIDEILRRGRVPVWSTGIENLASRRLAKKLGFSELGEIIYLTM